jgi:hypothetical protein
MRSSTQMMEVPMKTLLVAALALVFASTAWAQKSPSGNTAFDGMDKNRDGYLSKEEIAARKSSPSASPSSTPTRTAA